MARLNIRDEAKGLFGVEAMVVLVTTLGII